jgi:hypothetical protein
MHRNKLSWSMKSSNFLSEKTLVQFAHDNKDPGHENINFTRQSSSREADSPSACQQISSSLCMIRVHYRVRNTPPLVPILCQKNPIHIFVCYCFHLAQYREQWRAVVNTVMNIRVIQKTGNFFTSLATTVFSMRTLYRDILPPSLLQLLVVSKVVPVLN